MKQKRILALILSLTLLCSLLPAAYAAGAAPGDVSGDGKVTAEDARLCLRQAVGLENYEKDSAEFLACDVTNDGAVTAEDARLILRAAVGLETLHTHSFGEWTPETDEAGALTGKHYRTCACGEIETEDCAYGEKTALSENKEPTCTESAEFEQVCTVCGGKVTETEVALGHSFGEEKMLVNQDQVCTRCGKKILSFNSVVNVLKQDEHSYTGFSETINKGEVPYHKFNISLAARAAAAAAGEKLDEETIVKQFTEEMAKSGHEYGAYADHRKITDQNFYRLDKSTVCDLAEADIQSLTVEEIEGIDFLTDLPDIVKIKSAYSSASFDFDLSEKIKKANIGSVLKVTVTLKDENYADMKDSDAETALMKGMDQDLRVLVGELNQSEDVDGMKYEMKCDNASSKGTVTYYLDAVTMLPVAAVYHMEITTTETFTLDMKLAGIRMMDGKMTIAMENQSNNYYFFDGYFD